MSYFHFHINKAIRKVLFLPIFSEGLIKVLFLALETSIVNWLPAHFIKNSFILMVLGVKGVMS